MLKVVTLLVLLVCTVAGARSCSSSGPHSDLNPSNVLGNGLAGVCANQQSVDSSGGADGAGGALSQSAQSQLGSALGLLGQKSPSSISCPTTTTTGG